MALTDLASVKAWASPNLNTDRDTEITAAVNAASAWLASVCGRVFEKWSTAKTFYFDGSLDPVGARGMRDTIYLHPGHRPIVHSGGDLLTVTENGTALTVATGYDATADVILVGANASDLGPVDDRRGMLIRSGSWSSGIQNIAVTYKAGRDVTGAELTAELKQLANEVSWLMFTEPERLAKASSSRPGKGATFVTDLLSPISRELFERLLAEGRPRELAR